MNYRSVADLNKAVIDWSARLPADLDLIVGIPRSGLLAANLLALHRNLPLTDVDGLLAQRLLRSGARGQGRHIAAMFDRPLNVLVVDDSLLSGGQLDQIRTLIASQELPHTIRYGVVFITEDGERRVDTFAEIVPLPRVFEWNILHNPVLAFACVDIDGVLCRDPRPEENDDGPRYLEFLENATPYLIPTMRIGWLVTSRLEKFRTPTEKWLARHGVQYDHLVMLDLPDQQARIRERAYGSHKAEIYRRCDAKLFIESSAEQALEISELTGMSVWCVETREMIEPGRLAAIKGKMRRLPGRLPARLRRLRTRLLG